MITLHGIPRALARLRREVMGHPSNEISTSFQGEFSRNHPVSWSQQQGTGDKLRLFVSRDLLSIVFLSSRHWLPISSFLRDADTHYVGKSARKCLFT